MALFHSQMRPHMINAYMWGIHFPGANTGGKCESYQ